MNGPGELTLTSIVLFTLGAYGVAAGAASGEQSVVAVGVFAFVLFVVGIIWPIVALSGVGVAAWTPADAVVGEIVRPARPAVRPGDARRGAGARPARRVVGHRVARRGRDPAARRTAAASSAACGSSCARRRRSASSSARASCVSSCRSSWPVAPRPTGEPPRLSERPHDGATSAASVLGPRAGDTVRSVRPYVPGDPARLVHWPTSARRGTLVIREHEPPAAIGVALVVDLNGARDDVEEAASRAAGIGLATLAAGGAVWCCTSEADGPVSAPVADARELNRRLARARDGVPPVAARGLARRSGAREA